MTADSNSVKVCDLRADDKAGVCIVRNGDSSAMRMFTMTVKQRRGSGMTA